MAVGILRSGDWPAARHIGRCATPPVVVDKILFGFAICGCIPEIFATKVGSCQKSRRIMDDFFAVPNFRGRAFQNLYPFYPAALQHVAWKKFCEDTPTNPEVIGAHTVNFKPNFTFSRLIFLGTPVPIWLCASKAWSICSDSNSHVITVIGPKFTRLFSSNAGGIALVCNGF